MVGLTINYIVTARLLRAVTPSFGKLAAIEAKLEVGYIIIQVTMIADKKVLMVCICLGRF